MLSALIILIPTLFILFQTGSSGLYSVLLALFTTLVLSIKALISRRIPFQTKELPKGLLFILIAIGLMLAVSKLDFEVVETFKKYGVDIASIHYWYYLFGFLTPISFLLMAIMFFIGSKNSASSIKFLVIAALIANSNINDLSYYLFNGVMLPKFWTWLVQPTFLFGNSITTIQLLIWIAISIFLSLIVALVSSDKHPKRVL